MAEDQSAPFTSEQFAAGLRQEYPELADVKDDHKLTHAFLKVHPQYKPHVIDVLEGSEAAPVPRLPGDGPEPIPAPSGYEPPDAGNEFFPPLTDYPARMGAAAKSLLLSPVTGTQRAFKGATALLSHVPQEQQGQGGAEGPPPVLEPSQLATGLGDVVEGGMEAGTLAMGPPLVSAPVRTLAALAGATALGAVGQRGATALGFSPEWSALSGDLASLIGAVGSHYLAGISEARAGAARLSQLAGEDAAAAGDAAFEQRYQANIADTEFTSAAAQGQLAAVKRMHDTRPGTAWDYLNQLKELDQPRVTPSDLSKTAPPPGMRVRYNQEWAPGVPKLPSTDIDVSDPRAVAEYLAQNKYYEPIVAPLSHQLPEQGTPRTTIVGAPPTLDVESVGEGGPPVAQASLQEFPRLINTLGEQVGSQLENQPPPGSPFNPAIRPTELQRTRLRERQDFQDTRKQELADMASQVADQPYQPGKLVTEPESSSSYYTPPTGASPTYHQIVGDATTKPKVSLIRDVLHAYAETGAESAKDLPEGYSPSDVKYGPREFKNAYDRWVPEIDKVLDKRARARYNRNKSYEESQFGQDQPPIETEAAPIGEGQPPVAAGGPGEGVPDFLAQLQAEPDVQGGYEPGEVIGQEQPPIGTGQPPQATTAEPPPRLPFLERLKGEEGHLIFNISPGNKRGLADWLERNQDEYGDSDWWQAAKDDLDTGNASRAWKVVHLSVSQLNAGQGATGLAGSVSRSTEDSSIPGVPTAKVRNFVEDQIGHELPHGTTIGPGGVLKLPKNPGGLDPKYSDLAIGKFAMDTALKVADPTQIIRVETPEGKLDEGFVKAHPEMRITPQIADELVKDLPDAFREIAEETGLTGPALGAHLIRATSQAGKLLNSVMQWQRDNWDDILHLSPLSVSDRGPGAAGRLEFLSPEKASIIKDYLQGKGALADIDTEGLIKELHRATPDALKEIGFTFPEEVEPDSPQAKTYTRNWLAKQRRMIRAAETVGHFIEENQPLSQALFSNKVLGVDAGEKVTGAAGKVGESLDAMSRASLSYLISGASTFMHVLWSQGVGYNMAIVEEALSAAAASVIDPGAMNKHWLRAKELAKSEFAGGTVPLGIMKKPWIDGIQASFDYITDAVSGMKPNDARRSLATLEKFPTEAQHAFGSLTINDSGQLAPGQTNVPIIKQLTSRPLLNALTAGMRVQEGMYRAAAFDAILRSEILAKGGNPTEILANPKNLIDKYGQDEARRMAGAAVAYALDLTQAGDPLEGTFPAKVLDFFKWGDNPVLAAALRLAEPFPRFAWASVPRMVWDRIPGAPIIDLIRPGGPLLSGRFTTKGVAEGLKIDLGPAAYGDTAGDVRGGRIALGLKRRALERSVIPDITRERANANYQAATSFGDAYQAKLEASQAAKSWKALHAKAEKGGFLPEINDQMEQLARTMQDRKAAGDQAMSDYKLATSKAKDLADQEKKASAKLRALEEISAPTPSQIFARQATGTMMFMAAMAIRAAQPDDSKWNEVEVGGHRIDVKWVAQYSLHMFLADVVHDYLKNTSADWTHPFGTKEYTGKYVRGNVIKEGFEVVLSTNSVVGGTSAIIDAITGKTSRGESLLDYPGQAAAALVGELMGRFTFPLRQIDELIGGAEGTTSRIPEKPGEFSSIGKQLVQPALGNIPGLNRLIPPKVDPMTGQPKGQELSAMKPFTGLNAHIASQLEKEMNKTGVEYSALVPKVSGDRELDNKIATAYGDIMKDNLPAFLAQSDYQAMDMDQRRDKLAQFAGRVRRAAYGTVMQQMEEPEQLATKAKLTSQGQKEKQARWMRWIQKQEEMQAPPEAEVGEPSGDEPPSVEPGG